jgi:hypothetical protein
MVIGTDLMDILKLNVRVQKKIVKLVSDLQIQKIPLQLELVIVSIA